MNTDAPLDLYKKIRGHVGTHILEALKAHGISARIFSGNCLQLRQLIKLLEDPAGPTKEMGLEQEECIQTFLDEVVRHFHNYLASIKTLVAHSRHLIGENFIKPKHRQEYQKKVNDVFANDPFAQFMEDFRDYMLHYAIPIVGITKNFGSPNAASKPAELNVDLNHLAKWGGWTAPSKKFINANRPKIRMLKLVDDYEHKVRVFHEEFGQSFQRYYEPEINEALALTQKWYLGKT